MSRKEQLLQELVEIKRFLPKFLRHPMTEIKQVPDWPWHRILIVQILISAATGALSGLVEQKISWSIVVGLFLSPILTFVTLSVSTLFFYYCFQIFAEKTVSIRKLFLIILLANIPQFIFQIIAGYLPPITLIGMAFTALLLLVGFVENFQLDRKLTIRLIAGLYAIFFVIWMWNRIASMNLEKSWSPQHNEAPEVELGK